MLDYFKQIFQKWKICFYFYEKNTLVCSNKMRISHVKNGKEQILFVETLNTRNIHIKLMQSSYKYCARLILSIFINNLYEKTA